MKSKLTNLKEKKVLILGFGREGQSTYKFLRKHFPDKKLGIADLAQKQVKSDKNLTLYFGKNYLKSLDDFQLVIKTPGIPHKLSAIKKAKKRGVKFTSQTQIFLELVEGKVVGATGTCGKSTTATLIDCIIKEAGLKSVLLGNIGKPALDYLDKDGDRTIFVFELSSHQLFDLRKSPHVAIFLNIFPEHLDYYENFNQYRNAKVNITKHQTEKDFFIYNTSFEFLNKVAKKTKANKSRFALGNKQNLSSFVKNGAVYFKKQDKISEIIKLSEIILLGKHNLNNVMAAILACKALGLKNSDIRAGIMQFKPLKHRMEYAGIYKGVVFINDSISTTPETAIAAMESFKDRPLTLILGGFDRGIDYSTLASKLTENRDIKAVILVGSVAPRIYKSLSVANCSFKIIRLEKGKMDKIVKKAFKETPSGGVVLFSPAAASFDMFENYKDRGNQFKQAVKSLKKQAQKIKDIIG